MTLRGAVILALILALSYVSGHAYELRAQRLHNSVVINACYKIRNGQLRLAAVSSDGRLFCRRNELPIQWPATCECEP